jgi:hypothetical protein
MDVQGIQQLDVGSVEQLCHGCMDVRSPTAIGMVVERIGHDQGAVGLARSRNGLHRGKHVRAGVQCPGRQVHSLGEADAPFRIHTMTTLDWGRNPRRYGTAARTACGPCSTPSSAGAGTGAVSFFGVIGMRQG